MVKSVAAKMGIKEGVRSIVINAPADAIKAIDAPSLDLHSRLSGNFFYIHLFVTDAERLQELFPKLKKHLAPTGMLWVSWPKGDRQSAGLTLPVIIKTGYDYGLVESKTLSVNSTWSAIKFTHPKQGKVYNNSYGRLKA
jgi:hypothetical protein